MPLIVGLACETWIAYRREKNVKAEDDDGPQPLPMDKQTIIRNVILTRGAYSSFFFWINKERSDIL